MSPAIFDYIIKMVCCVFAAGILIYVFYPSRDTDTGTVKTRAAYLDERKEVVYENLRDLAPQSAPATQPASQPSTTDQPAQKPPQQ